MLVATGTGYGFPRLGNVSLQHSAKKTTTSVKLQVLITNYVLKFDGGAQWTP